jgi:hypothetical protein
MRKNLVAMLLAVGVIATATGCGSTESTSTTSTTEYVTEEATTEEAQVEETTEYVEATTEEVVEETKIEVKVEDINVNELITKESEAFNAAKYVTVVQTVDYANDLLDYVRTMYYDATRGIVYAIDNKVECYAQADLGVVYVLNNGDTTWLKVDSKEETDKTFYTLKASEYSIWSDAGYPFTVESIDGNIVTLVSETYTNVDGLDYYTKANIDIETGLIISVLYEEVDSTGTVVNYAKYVYEYPVEGTPEYDELIQKATIPAEAIEAANNQ